MNEVEVMGKQIANPFGQGREVAAVSAGALISVEQQKAVAEVQARMMIARANPRDVIRATDLILQDCTRPTLAHGALYQYSRGGSDISGPSIRLAEAIASRWGNIASGIKEISRYDGYSECIAYAWDLETGYYDERQFQVRHWRDTNKGGYHLRDERDIYELIANMGQRRKRAVLLTVIPGDVVEAAVEQCEETLRASADTSPEALKKIVEAFGAYGVSQDAIEKRIQRRLEAVRPAQVIQLRRIYNSLKDGVSEPSDWFGADPVMEAQVNEWRDKKENKPTKTTWDDAGLDIDALIAQGNVACRDKRMLEDWWREHLSSEQRGMLGAKGKGVGPYLPQWKEGQQVSKASQNDSAEPPAAVDVSAETPQAVGDKEDVFGLQQHPDEAFARTVIAAIDASATVAELDAARKRWSEGGEWHKRMSEIPEASWQDIMERYRQKEDQLTGRSP